MKVDEAGGLGAAVSVVDTDVRDGGRSENLALVLVLEGVVGLDEGDREVARGVGLEVRVPEETIYTAEHAEA